MSLLKAKTQDAYLSKIKCSMLATRDENFLQPKVCIRSDNKLESRKRKFEQIEAEVDKRPGVSCNLEKLKKQLCPKDVNIELKRIRFREILITTPKKGFREVHYSSIASDSSDCSDSEEEEDSCIDSEPEDQDKDIGARQTAKDGKQTEEPKTEVVRQNDTPHDEEEYIDNNKFNYEDWRLQTIRAFTSDSDKAANDESFFMEIPASHDFLFSVNYAKDDLHAILDILGGHAMSSMIIDGYLMLRLDKYFKDFELEQNRIRQKQLLAAEAATAYNFRNSDRTKRFDQLKSVQSKPTNFLYLSVNFMAVRDRDQPVSTFVPNMKFLPDLSKLEENSDAQLICPLYASKHLYLAVFDFSKKLIHVYDSSWHYLPNTLREGQLNVILREITRHHSKGENNQHPASAWKLNFVATSCPQYDEYSCGIFTIYYAENVLKGIAYYKNGWQLSHKRVREIRRHIVKELLSTTSAGSKILRALS